VGDVVTAVQGVYAEVTSVKKGKNFKNGKRQFSLYCIMLYNVVTVSTSKHTN